VRAFGSPRRDRQGGRRRHIVKGEEETPPEVRGPARWSCAPIVLEMGSTADSEPWEWHQRVKRMSAQGNRKAIAIIQQDEAREEVKRWLVLDAWPSKFTAPEFDATSSDNAIESVEIERLQLSVRPAAIQ